MGLNSADSAKRRIAVIAAYRAEVSILQIAARFHLAASSVRTILKVAGVYNPITAQVHEYRRINSSIANPVVYSDIVARADRDQLARFNAQLAHLEAERVSAGWARRGPMLSEMAA